MGRFVIVAYRPKPGQREALDHAVAAHLRVLRAEGLVSDTPASVMRAADGTVVEVFEWRSAEAIVKAHASSAVQALWAEFAAACEIVPLASLAEAQRLFAEFDAVSPASRSGDRSMPFSPVVPVLHYPDVAVAADWLVRAFGFRVRLRIGDHRVQLSAGDGDLVIARSASTADTAVLVDHSVTVRIDDVTRHVAEARAAGARIVEEPADQPYGERQYAALDPAGHRWTFSETIGDVDPAVWGSVAAF